MTQNKEKGKFADIDRILADLPENRVTEVPDEIREKYDKYEKEEMEDALALKKSRKGKGRKRREDSGRRERGTEAPDLTGASLVIDTENLADLENHPLEGFLTQLTKDMGLNLSFKLKGDDEMIYAEIFGSDTGAVIGKRGQTLDAVQYLASLFVNKDSENYIRVVLAAENYRAKREKTLVNLATRLAGQVERTKRSIALEPMNPYERKVIHMTLQDRPKVKTRSEGKEPYRRVIIEKK